MIVYYVYVVILTDTVHKLGQEAIVFVLHPMVHMPEECALTFVCVQTVMWLNNAVLTVRWRFVSHLE